MRDHELQTFLNQDLREMESEYERIRHRTVEDPGTAGDEGEEAWASVIRRWLPDSYLVCTKGRILNREGEASPQIDIVVLRPGYPRRLLEKKLYLSGGVVAAFECKNTLTTRDLVKTWNNAKAINDLDRVEDEQPLTPFESVVPRIFYGLLAHGHSWNSSASNPIQHINSKLQQLVNETDLMIDMLSFVCVANLASWDALRILYDGPGLIPPDLWEARKRIIGVDSDEPTCSFQYNIAMSNMDSYEISNPIGVLIANILGRLAHDDLSILPMSQYFFGARIAGSQGLPTVSRSFSVSSQMRQEVVAQLPHRLVNGSDAGKWPIATNF